MIKNIFIPLIIIYIFSTNSAYSQPFNFEKTYSAFFNDGSANQVAYLTFPDIPIWGYLEITITGAYWNAITTGKLTKRIAIGRNPSSAGGYFNQNTEIVDAFGYVAQQWNIGDFDNTNLRIPIYHLNSSGNMIIVKVQGLLIYDESTTLASSINFENPVTSTFSLDRQYKSIMQDRVGIGTPSPGYKLDISGELALGSGSVNANTTKIFLRNPSGKTWAISSGANNITEGSLSIYNWTDNQTTPLIQISNSGNVLIGQTTQQNTSYMLDVAGKVRANEVVVNTTGADYVFDSNYKLRKLNDVEQFIKQNKHLPGIAPAKTMQDSGVNVSDMQNKLLQKVEELTLYVIEQNKKIEAQSEEIKELKTKIKN